MKCAFPSTKIAASFETAKPILLKSVKEFEKVRSGLIDHPLELHAEDMADVGFPEANLSSKSVFSHIRLYQ